MSDKPIAIVIPTMGRAELLFPLAWNIARTTPTGVFQIYFVANVEDNLTQEAILKIEGPVQMVMAHKRGYPCAVNAGVREVKERWVAIVNDDVRFHDGWLKGLFDVMTPTTSVIATNDLSPHTANGDACTQPVVERRYIETYGGAWDEPGVTMHEGYWHNFSETELYDVARSRGVATYAPGSIIEHLHPDWGKAEIDDTYLAGSKKPGTWEHDHDLYVERAAQWQPR